MTARSAPMLMERALRGCARRGEWRVAIYGAGVHTRLMGDALCEPPVEITSVIDDDPARIGQRLWNFPVVSLDDVGDVDAIVLSSDAAEQMLWDNTAALRERGVRVVRLHEITGDAGVSRRVAVWPPVESRERWGDLCARLWWYLSPAVDGIETVMIPVRGDIGGELAHPDDVPACLVTPESGPLIDRVSFIDPDALDDADPDMVLVWDDAAESDQLVIPGREILSIDSDRRRYSSMTCGTLADRIMGIDPESATISRARFETMRAEIAARPESDNVYVFGTGPSLPSAMEMDFSDGVCLACNSIIADRELMDHLKPPLVVFADPVFHMGPSRYASDFRDTLITAVRDDGLWVLVPLRDFRVLTHHLPTDVAERLIGVPSEGGGVPQIDLDQRFVISETANILTLLLLPLAFTFGKRVGIVGCDGRPLDENGYFWTHDQTAQLPERMNDAKRAHPGFFKIDYLEYYQIHCKTVGRWIDAALQRGITVESLTPSYIPALAQEGVACHR